MSAVKVTRAYDYVFKAIHMARYKFFTLVLVQAHNYRVQTGSMKSVRAYS